MPVRTYRQGLSSKQQAVTQQTAYETQSMHSTHAQIPLYQQQQEQYQMEQEVPSSQYYSSQTMVQPQQQHLKLQPQQQPASIPSYTSVSNQQPHHQAPLQSQPMSPQFATPQQPQTSSSQFVPQAPPLMPNFNTRPNYSDQKIKFLNGGLKDTPLYTGAETVFEIQFSGQPDKVQWFRNEVEIMMNQQQTNNRSVVHSKARSLICYCRLRLECTTSPTRPPEQVD